MTDANKNSTCGGIDRLVRSCSLSPNRLRWPWVVTMIVAAAVALFLLLSFNA